MNSIPDADFRFYPNPVDKLLIIRSSHALNIQIMDIVRCGYGLRRKWMRECKLLMCPSLQKGNYILKATDKTTNSVISEQLVKNN